jgi:hypothetical protein
MSHPPVSGHGSFEFPNGKYTGEWLNSLPHGQGRVNFHDGNSYEGTYRNGLQHGIGFYTWRNGDKHEGEWVDGKRHGEGFFTWANGNMYEGAFENDQFHGKGSFKFNFGGQLPAAQGGINVNDGDVLDGVFERMKPHGKCTYTFFTGEKFECTFVEGRCPEFDARQADVRAKSKATIQVEAGAVSCHVHDPAALFIRWDSVFIAIGSSSFSFGSTIEKACTGAREAQQSSFGDRTHGTFALEGCRATAAAELAGRSHIMAVEYPSAPAFPKHHFAFDNRHLRDAFVQRLQVC